MVLVEGSQGCVGKDLLGCVRTLESWGWGFGYVPLPPHLAADLALVDEVGNFSLKANVDELGSDGDTPAELFEAQGRDVTRRRGLEGVGAWCRECRWWGRGMELVGVGPDVASDEVFPVSRKVYLLSRREPDQRTHVRSGTMSPIRLLTLYDCVISATGASRFVQDSSRACSDSFSVSVCERRRLQCLCLPYRIRSFSVIRAQIVRNH